MVSKDDLPTEEIGPDVLEDVGNHRVYKTRAGEEICVDCGMDGRQLLENRPCAGDDYLLG